MGSAAVSPPSRQGVTVSAYDDSWRAAPVAARARGGAVSLLLLGALLPDLRGVSPVWLIAPIVMVMVAHEMTRDLPRISRAIVVSLGLLIVLGLPALVAPPTTAYGQEKILRFASLTLLTMLATSLIRGEQELTWFAWSWVLMAVVLGAATLGGVGGLEVGDRAAAFSNNPIWLARALASAIIALAWLASCRLMGIVTALLLSAPVVAALVASGSRGPAIGAAIGLLVILIRSGALKRGWVAIALSGPVLVAGMVHSGLIADGVFGRLAVNPLDDESGQQRAVLASATWDVIKAHPAGVGYGNWRAAAGSVRHAWPHNLYLEVLAEAGWLPGAILASFLVATLVALWRRAKPASPSLLVLALLAAESFYVSVSGDLNARSFFAVLVLGASMAWPLVPNASLGEAHGRVYS